MNAPQTHFVGCRFYRAKGCFNVIDANADDILFCEESRKTPSKDVCGYSPSSGVSGSARIDLDTKEPFPAEHPLFFDCPKEDIKRRARKQWIINKLEKLELVWANYKMAFSPNRFSPPIVRELKIVFHRKKADKIYALPYVSDEVYVEHFQDHAINFEFVDIDSICAPTTEEILLAENKEVIAALWGPYLPYIKHRVVLAKMELDRGTPFLKEFNAHIERLKECKDFRLANPEATTQPTREEAFAIIQERLQHYNIAERVAQLTVLWREINNDLSAFVNDLPKQFIDSFLREKP